MKVNDRQPKREVAKRNLSWTTYHRMINRLYRKINWKVEEFDAIVAINRGGNIIGTMLSHKARLSLHVVSKEETIGVRGKVLIVDDISDTGSTFLKVISNLKSGTEYKTASLHIQPHTKHVPDFYVSKTKNWVVYPYERVKKHKKRISNGI